MSGFAMFMEDSRGPEKPQFPYESSDITGPHDSFNCDSERRYERNIADNPEADHSNIGPGHYMTPVTYAGSPDIY